MINKEDPEEMHPYFSGWTGEVRSHVNFIRRHNLIIMAYSNHYVSPLANRSLLKLAKEKEVTS